MLSYLLIRAAYHALLACIFFFIIIPLFIINCSTFSLSPRSSDTHPSFVKTTIKSLTFILTLSRHSTIAAYLFAQQGQTRRNNVLKLLVRISLVPPLEVNWREGWVGQRWEARPGTKCLQAQWMSHRPTTQPHKLTHAHTRRIQSLTIAELIDLSESIAFTSESERTGAVNH